MRIRPIGSMILKSRSTGADYAEESLIDLANGSHISLTGCIGRSLAVAASDCRDYE